MAKLHMRSRELNRRQLRPLGVDGKEHTVLTALAHGGPLSQHQLSGHLQIDRTTVVAVVDRLEAAGLVQRRRNARDRRAYAVTLTEEGRRIQAAGERLVIETEDELMSVLNQRERAELLLLLGRLVESFPADA